MTEQQRHLPSASMEIEPCATIAIDLQQPQKAVKRSVKTCAMKFTMPQERKSLEYSAAAWPDSWPHIPHYRCNVGDKKKKKKQTLKFKHFS